MYHNRLCQLYKIARLWKGHGITMRFLNNIKNDIQFQIKYGFYFLYAFFSIIYIGVLIITPLEYKNIVASLIILTDPAMLGVFFIGGIWLLEKGEGLHHFWNVSPLRPLEYILSKAISLAILSTISSNLIILIGMRSRINFGVLSLSVFIGAVAFNLIGLMIASYARSVNHYMLIVTIPAVFLSIPPILTAFGFTHPFLEIFPGTALWRIIACSIKMERNTNYWLWINLVFWLGCALFSTNLRIPTALQVEGGKTT